MEFFLFFLVHLYVISCYKEFLMENDNFFSQTFFIWKFSKFFLFFFKLPFEDGENVKDTTKWNNILTIWVGESSQAYQVLRGNFLRKVKF